MKQFIAVIFAVFVILSVFSFSVFADGEEVTSIPEQSSTTTTTIEATQLPTMEDIHQDLLYILLAVSMLVGCLIAQALSFWKW